MCIIGPLIMTIEYLTIWFWIKDDCYGLGKNNQNQQLLDILACNSANNHSFTWITGQNVQKLQILAILAYP